MEKVALSVLALLAVGYLIFMVVGAISILPFGILPLLALFAMGVFFFKALSDKLNNTEDSLYDEKVEP